jgi:feruloyl esterase
MSDRGGAGRYRARNANPYQYPYGPIFIATNNPDLRAFKAAGGKMITYHGWMDELTVPENSVDYYEMVERAMGGRAATQDFFRLFMIPGQSHIPGGPGAEVVDYITALENWVENGIAPDRLIAHNLVDFSRFYGPVIAKKTLVKENIIFTRPAFPYPIQARYSGMGDPNDEASFVPFTP